MHEPVGPAGPAVVVTGDVSAAAVEALGPGTTVRRCTGTDRGDLLAAVGRADALLVSRTTDDVAAAIAVAPRLRVIASVDGGSARVVAVAARAGVLVVTGPTAHLVNSAERTVRMLLTAARHVTGADTARRYVDVELTGRVLGVVGTGRVGALVAARMHAFGMRVVVSGPAATDQAHVPRVCLDTLLGSADFIVIDGTDSADGADRADGTDLIGEPALRRVKATVRIVNTAGAAVDRAALLAAVEEGRVTVGLDVEREPRLTAELAVAESVRLALQIDRPPSPL